MSQQPTPPPAGPKPTEPKPTEPKPPEVRPVGSPANPVTPVEPMPAVAPRPFRNPYGTPYQWGYQPSEVPGHGPAPGVIGPGVMARSAALFGRFWRRSRRPADPRVLGGTVLAGLITVVTLPAPPGVQWPVIGGVIAAAVVRAARRPLSRGDRLLLGLVLALVVVGALRTSAEIVTLCMLAALGLGALLAVGGRTWPGVLMTPLLLGIGGLRSLPWAARAARSSRVPAGTLPVVRGVAVAAVLVWICGALLASADSAFAGLISAITDVWSIDQIPARLALGGLVAALTLALAFNAAVPPRWHVLKIPRRSRPVMEWLVPVVAIDALLATFIAVQVVVLFDAYPPELVTGDATPAERARQGFGQLVVLTLVVAALLGWAARRADAEEARARRLLTAGGGTLLVLTLVLVASALRRLWLYEQNFGWTVLRLHVGVFEVWLGLVIVLAGVAWLVRRTAIVPRLVTVSAGVGLLMLGLAGPDALVASWNVDRYERTGTSGQAGKIDLGYLRGLSDDAVPALSRLPEPLRTCVLGGRDAAAPWYAVNVSRLRARSVLDSLAPLGDPAALTGVDCPAR